MEEGAQTLPPPPVEPISRPSSTSTSASAAVAQLPGISALSANNAPADSLQQSASTATPGQTEHQPQPQTESIPQLQDQVQLQTQPQVVPQQPPAPQPQPTAYHGPSPAATSGGHGNGLPTCQNCSTSTTPLWRRDEFGSVLCNACGLFLKLHGRPRPISLKTDVIKSRNRVKTMRTDLAPKKKNNAQSNQAARRKSANGNMDGHDSPISRTGTPGAMYDQAINPFMVNDPYPSAGVSGFGAAGDGSGSPLNGDRSLEGPQTHEQLLAHAASLKTRVSELEFINELFRGRLSQLEQQEAATRRDQEASGLDSRTPLEISQENEKQLRAQLDDSHRRENSLKRRLDELELELKELKDAAAAVAAVANTDDGSDRPAKKARLQSPEPEPHAQLEEAMVQAEVQTEEPEQTQEQHQDEPQEQQQPEAEDGMETELPEEPKLEAAS